MSQDKNGGEENLHWKREEELLGCRDFYNKAELEVSGRYDHWILTLSGGAIAISITFLYRIAPVPIRESMPWLERSWFCLLLSLLLGLISLLTSQSALREQRKELDRELRQGNPLTYTNKKPHTRITDLLNWCSALSFVAGVYCLFRFAIVSMPRL